MKMKEGLRLALTLTQRNKQVIEKEIYREADQEQ